MRPVGTASERKSCLFVRNALWDSETIDVTERYANELGVRTLKTPERMGVTVDATCGITEHWLL